MNAANCGVTDAPDQIFVLPTPPLIERIALSLLELGFGLPQQSEFAEESIAEMDLPDGRVLVWEAASEKSPRNHCDFGMCLVSHGATAFATLRLRLGVVLHPDRPSVERVEVTSTLETYRPQRDPPFDVETLTLAVTPNTWPEYEADVLRGRLLARAYAY